MSDNVNHPEHYTAGGVECIDALKAATEGLEGIQAVCTANAIKYLWRWKRKNGVEDLRKAVWYIERLIKEINNPNVVFSDEGLGEKEPEHIETCRERLQRERPDHIDKRSFGGCIACPDVYGYAERPDYCTSCKSDQEVCTACWDRPVHKD